MFLLTLEDAFFVRLQKGTMKFHCLLRPQRHFLELHRVDRVNLFEMPTGHSNNPLHNKIKQRENIADHCTSGHYGQYVQYLLLHSCLWTKDICKRC